MECYVVKSNEMLKLFTWYVGSRHSKYNVQSILTQITFVFIIKTNRNSLKIRKKKIIYLMSFRKVN